MDNLSTEVFGEATSTQGDADVPRVMADSWEASETRIVRRMFRDLCKLRDPDQSRRLPAKLPPIALK